MNRLRLSAELAHLPCGNITYCHKSGECASSAFELKEKTATVELRIPRAYGAVDILMELYCESLEKKICEVSGKWCELDGDSDVYSFTVDLKAVGKGLYFFRFTFNSFGNVYYSKKRQSGLSFTLDGTLSDLCQISVISFSHMAPEKMYGGIIYHVFVDRFNRGGKSSVPDGAIRLDGDWKRIPEYPEYPGAPLKNNTFYGGTLWGIADKLDYISSLGITAIYLSPIFKSVSNHKYDTADYMQVDEMFGGEAALEHLLSECNKRKISVILDGVFNHTGADSVYFNRYSRFNSLGAYQSKKSPYFSWFDFKNHPDKYTCWWNIEILPRINPDIPECRNYFVGEGGVIEKYGKMGVYGWRLDVADELSDEFISEIKSVASKDGESVVFGEVWEDASNKIAYDTRKKYYLGNELDGVMNYPLRRGIIEFLNNRCADALYYALTDVLINAPDRILHNQMNLLGTHDTDRIITVLGGVSSSGYTNKELCVKRMLPKEVRRATEKLKMAYTVLATLPGIPAVFYGDEAGLEGYHDPFNRMPYPWGKENKEILSHYVTLGDIRRKNSVYKRGAFSLVHLDSELLSFSRKHGKFTYITVCNNSEHSLSLEFSDKAKALIGKNNLVNHELPAMAAEIYKIPNGAEVTFD